MGKALKKVMYSRRIRLMLVRLGYMAPYWLHKMEKMGKDPSVPEIEKYQMFRQVVKRVNRAGRVKIEVSGLNNLPKEDGFVMFPNHQGHFDVLALGEAIDRPFGIVIKKEARDIILLKQVVTLLQGISIDRQDVRQAMKVIMKMTKEVKEGRNYVIFAEGTRSKNGNHLLPFKAGSFKSAMNAKCPVVPVALVDSFIPFDENSAHPVVVKVRVLKPIEFSEYKEMKSQELAAMTAERIQEEIDKMVDGSF